MGLTRTGRVTQTNVTNPNGNITQYFFGYAGYFQTGYTSQIVRAYNTPLQQAITITRDPISNLMTSQTEPLTSTSNRTTQYSYDLSNGDLLSVTRMAGTTEALTTQFTYEEKYHQIATITDPMGHTTTLNYDGLGNIQALVDGTQRIWSFTYRSDGRIATATEPLGNTTTYGYGNDFNDLTSITDPLGNITTRFLDPAGRLVSVTDPLGNRTEYGYDNFNEITKVTDPLNGLTQFGYDENGNLKTVTDPRNKITQYAYDAFDRLQKRTDPLGKFETYDLYDGNGNLQQFTDRKGQITKYVYDALNRRTFAGFGYNAGTNSYESTITYGYDAANRLRTVTDSVAGLITLTPDDLDCLTEESSPQGIIDYTCDAAGRRATMTVADQPTVNYGYDNANRLKVLNQTDGANFYFSYDAAGRRRQVSNFSSATYTTTSYDAASRVTGMSYSNGSGLLGTLTYTYDAAGRRTKLGGSWARVNIPAALASAMYNDANRLTSWNGATLNYDDNGNLTSDGTNSYSWNARNRLASMTGASFLYDGLGRRMQKTIGSTVTQFLYDGLNPVQEIGATGTANLITGLGIDEYFTRSDSAGSQNFFTDALGSTVALMDSLGNVQTQYTYEPFGNTTVTGQANSNSYQYTGRENDGTGLSSNIRM